jgi:hypothetical protein
MVREGQYGGGIKQRLRKWQPGCITEHVRTWPRMHIHADGHTLYRSVVPGMTFYWRWTYETDI